MPMVILMFVISVALSFALRPKPPAVNPQSMDAQSMPVAEIGKPVPVVFGQVWVRGSNILWYGNLRTSAIKSGGK